MKKWLWFQFYWWDLVSKQDSLDDKLRKIRDKSSNTILMNDDLAYINQKYIRYRQEYIDDIMVKVRLNIQDYNMKFLKNSFLNYLLKIMYLNFIFLIYIQILVLLI